MKKLSAFRLDPEVLALLKKLSEKNSRSQASMLEVLIKDAAKSQKIK